MSGLSTTAEVASICGGIVLPVMAIGGYIAKRWINEQIVTKLSNDDTPVAKYAHDARDYAKQALDAANQTNQILTAHVTDTGIHRVQK